MAGLTELLELPKPKKRRCRIGYVLSQLAPGDQTTLAAALATDDGSISDTAIITWIDERMELGGMTPDTRNVADHRKGRCDCA
jgi:hypothetical protein